MTMKTMTSPIPIDATKANDKRRKRRRNGTDPKSGPDKLPKRKREEREILRWKIARR